MGTQHAVKIRSINSVSSIATLVDGRAAIRKTLFVLLTVVLLALTASCGGSNEAFPTPEKAPKAVGKITKPALKPSWLTEVSGTAESTDTSGSDARSGALLTTKYVVSYSGDLVSAVNRKTGKTTWRSNIDLHGGVICQTSRLASPATKTFTFSYSDGSGTSLCQNVATISLLDGKVLDQVVLRDVTKSEDAFAVYASSVATAGGRTFVMDSEGAIWRVGAQGKLKVAKQFKTGGDVDYTMATMKDTSTLVVATDSGDRYGDEMLTALKAPKLTERWSVQMSDVIKGVGVPGDREAILDSVEGRMVRLQQGATYYVVTLDPKTGKRAGVLGREAGRGDTPDALMLNRTDEFNNPDLMAFVDNDLIIRNSVRMISRVSPASDKVVWTFDGTKLDLRRGYDDAFLEPGPLSSDRKHLAVTVSNGQSLDIVVLNVKTGKLEARWAVPDKYSRGLSGSPYLRWTDGGFVLVRNPTLYGAASPFEDIPDPRKTTYAAGFFRFPAAG